MSSPHLPALPSGPPASRRTGDIWSVLEEMPPEVVSSFQDYALGASELLPSQMEYVRDSRRAIDLTYAQPSSGTRSQDPHATRALGALLLADSRRSIPDDCLDRTVAAIRVMESFALDPDPFVAHYHVQFAHIAQRVMLECARQASMNAQRRAAVALRLLGRYGRAMAYEEYARLLLHAHMGAEQLRITIDTHFLPGMRGKYWQHWRELSGRLELLHTAYIYLGQGSQSMTVTTDLHDAPIVLQGAVEFDAVGVMSIRQSALALCAYVEVADGGFPDVLSCADDPLLADPFTGHPFEWHRGPGSTTATVVSAGPARVLNGWLAAEIYSPPWQSREALTISLRNGSEPN